MLLQLKELADEVLFCETQRLQLAEDLLKYLQKEIEFNTLAANINIVTHIGTMAHKNMDKLHSVFV